MTEKIQYFMPDLSYKLGVGEIKEIHIAEQNGRAVLRIECEKLETSEYKTIKATKPAKLPKKPKQQSKPAQSGGTASKSVAEKLMAGAKDFLSPERNKGKREMFGDQGFGGNSGSFEGPNWK
jgi:hypothetical protein